MNIDTSKATPELLAALSAAQGEIENASKNAANPHFKSKYADLAEILNTTRPVFAKHGLSLSQFPGFDGALCSVTTLVGHKLGGYLVGVAACVPSKTDAQGIGSATTYLRRYAAAAAAGIAQEDDDGNSAAHNGKPRPLSTVNASPMSGVWDGFNEEARAYLEKVAANAGALWAAGDDSGALDKYEIGHDTEERSALWSLFPSNMRSALKRLHDTRKKAAA